MGVVHGDPRPANLMVQPDGSTKIIDLGSAVVQGETLRQRVFTLAYAAPEVLESKDWTRQSDLASLGYVLLELLTGRRLFAAVQSIEQLLERKTSPCPTRCGNCCQPRSRAASDWSSSASD